MKGIQNCVGSLTREGIQGPTALGTWDGEQLPGQGHWGLKKPELAEWGEGVERGISGGAETQERLSRARLGAHSLHQLPATLADAARSGCCVALGTALPRERRPPRCLFAFSSDAHTGSEVICSPNRPPVGVPPPSFRLSSAPWLKVFLSCPRVPSPSQHGARSHPSHLCVCSRVCSSPP